MLEWISFLALKSLKIRFLMAETESELEGS